MPSFWGEALRGITCSDVIVCNKSMRHLGARYTPWFDQRHHCAGPGRPGAIHTSLRSCSFRSHTREKTLSAVQCTRQQDSVADPDVKQGDNACKKHGCYAASGPQGAQWRGIRAAGGGTITRVGRNRAQHGCGHCDTPSFAPLIHKQGIETMTMRRWNRLGNAHRKQRPKSYLRSATCAYPWGYGTM